MKKRILALAAGLILVVGTVQLTGLAAPRPGVGALGAIRATLEQILDIVTGTEADVQDVAARLDDPATGLAEIKAEVRAIEDSLQGAPRVVQVSASFATYPDSQTGVNVDYVGGLPIVDVKRYTLLVQASSLVTLPPGSATLEVFSGVWDPVEAAAYSVRVYERDVSALSPLPHPGGAFGPFAGTNTHLRVTRGSDGLGEVIVRVNAYVEIAP